jgi:hypothetical protein
VPAQPIVMTNASVVKITPLNGVASLLDTRRGPEDEVMSHPPLGLRLKLWGQHHMQARSPGKLTVH